MDYCGFCGRPNLSDKTLVCPSCGEIKPTKGIIPYGSEGLSVTQGKLLGYQPTSRRSG